MKIYKNTNVYDEAIKRLETIFDEFNNIYFSVSGGKDSSVMVQLANKVAKHKNKKFDVLFIDLEAQYKATIEHIEELKELSQIRTFYHICLPISLRNAVSIIQPKWVCWDKKDKHKWVRDMPKNVISDCNYFSWFEEGMEFEEFIIKFAKWYLEKNSKKCATGIGIRSDESLNRFTTIISEKKVKYKNLGWTTKLKINQKHIDIYNFFPLYDWSTSDIWGAVFKDNMSFNEIYELMYKNGLSIHEARLCQPYGDDQRNGLDQFKAIEYDTWEKVLNRVSGVNFGNIYARSSLLGNIKSEKPDSMTWEQYAIWLLESLGLYAKEVEIHYYNKIKIAMKWWRDKEGVEIIPDEADSKMESARKVASWRRIARAIEKNDFWMKRLSFGQNKSDVKKLYELKQKYKNIIFGKDTTDKHLKKIAEEMN